MTTLISHQHDIVTAKYVMYIHCSVLILCNDYRVNDEKGVGLKEQDNKIYLLIDYINRMEYDVI